MQQFDGTTIVSVRRGSQVAIGGDGQVSLGNTIIKATARKVRKLYNNTVLAGFAGGTADAFTLIELFEAKLQKHQGRPSPATATCSNRKATSPPSAAAGLLPKLPPAR